ncbi:Fic family protein [Puniceibacterium sp. HSS470]|jgi:Fic family protein|nr:Fic family protein [Puniceibacterium sp. HSS470]|tara:strand:- start:2400 stop:3476 length:1077 start_codon:yes stop_codon:yes gene_type:complete
MPLWNAPAWPRFRHDPSRTEAVLARASARLGEISGLHAGLSEEDRRAAFLRAVTGEALASFSIEGVTLSPEEIEASVVASLDQRTSLQSPKRRSDAIADLMLEARTPDGPLTAERLWHWHALLFHGVEAEEKGRWRSFPMEIVRGLSGRREDVLYIAPPPDRVPGEIAQFLSELATDQNPLPIRAAIAHLWFESIHPFADGNGRIGRAIVEHVFAQEAALPFSLSRQIEADKRGYYAALQAGRRDAGTHIDATPFVLWFLERLVAGVDEAERDARFLVRRNAFFARFPDLPSRAEKVLRRLFAEGEARVEQGISAAPYSRIARVSPATATRDLSELERRAVLRRSAEGGRATRYFLNT